MPLSRDIETAIVPACGTTNSYLFKVVVFVIEPKTDVPIGNSIGEGFGGCVGVVITVVGGSAWELLLPLKNSDRVTYSVRNITAVILAQIIATVDPIINILLALFFIRIPSLLK